MTLPHVAQLSRPSPIGGATESRATPPSWLRRVAIANDYVRIPYANGSSFASQFLYRALEQNGHEVTIVGPEERGANGPAVGAMPPRHLCLASVPLRTHPGVHLALPSRGPLRALGAANFDVFLAQTCSALLKAGVWLRQAHQVPLVAVNTVHLPSVYNVVLPDWLNERAWVHELFRERIVPWVERTTAETYNRGDGLVVLSPGLKRYWEQRGVEVPIHVIPRAIEKRIFDGRGGADPFDERTVRGSRLLVVCRHVREKNMEQLLSIFARDILPGHRDVTLTLVGDGPDHDTFVRHAAALGLADRVFFAGERPLAEMPRWYAHADVFVYTSLSETYGQVIGEALHAGLPVVAFADQMGVSGQVTNGVDGYLVDPGSDERDAGLAFGSRVLQLLGDRASRARMGTLARDNAVRRSDPDACVARYYDAFESARLHRDAQPEGRFLRAASSATLASWTALHGVSFALGLLRPPVQLNRAKAQTPAWDL
ncbi:MAG: glycosyltransferase [Polyangiales bacterium]